MTTTDETALAAGSPAAYAPVPRGAARTAAPADVSTTTARTPRAAVPQARAGQAVPAAEAPAGPADDPRSALDTTLERAVAHLKSLQDDAGWWKGDLETNTTMDAEDLMLRHWLGIWNPEQAQRSARYIRSWQNADGSWPIYYGGAGEIATTVESYVALRMCGDSPDAPHMRRAAAWSRAHGGVPKTRVFTRMWLALFGWTRWEDLPVLPPELMFLPAKAPLSIYKFGSWARQTVVAITVLTALRPTGTPPFSIDELSPPEVLPVGGRRARRKAAGQQAATAWLDTGLDGLIPAQPADDGPGAAAPGGPAVASPLGAAAAGPALAQQPRAQDPARPDVAARAKDAGGPGLPLPKNPIARAGARARRGLKHAALEHIAWERIFLGLDWIMHRYERHPIRPLRAVALAAAEQWMIVRQEADGCFGGIQPPTVYTIIALRLLGYPMDHPVITAALRSLDEYSVTYDGVRMQEACQSPVWDTCLATIALADAGVPRDDDSLVRAADWMLSQEVRDRRGDWSVPVPDVPTGGWAFEFENDTYPDVDDSAEVMLALLRVAHPHPEQVTAATYRGLQWVFGMQCADGGWGAFDVNNAGEFVYKIPFADFGMLTDPPSADVTAHVVELLGELGLSDDPRTQRAVAWLLHTQEPDGSWYGRWGVNHIYGTGGVLPALRAAGVPASHPAIQRAADWLVSRQNPDGGWGEDVYSYEDMSTAGEGTSTASQTAWALLALIAADRVGDGPRGEAAARGVAWLASTQTAEGTWDEPQYTGTGFAGYFYINYHLYRLVWPVMALGRYRRVLAGDHH